MIIYGFPVNYEGDFGELPVVQTGKYKLIAIRNYDCVPIKLGILMVKAKQAGAQFLVIDPDPVRTDYAMFVDVPLAA